METITGGGSLITGFEDTTVGVDGAVDKDEGPGILFDLDTIGNVNGEFELDDLGVSAQGVPHSSSPWTSGIDSTISFRKSNLCSANIHCFLEYKNMESN